MTITQHTPGPWRAEKTGNPYAPGEHVIVTVPYAGDGGVLARDIRIDANARLIAAAPLAPHACANADCPGFVVLMCVRYTALNDSGTTGETARALLARMEKEAP